MGKRGIRLRKRRAKLPEAEDTGIIDDLEDQAEWSTYGRGIPRLGNPRRERIRLQRGWRAARRLREGTPEFRSRDWWTAVRVALLLGIVMIVVGGFLVFLLSLWR